MLLLKHEIDHTAQHPDYAEVVFEAIVSALDTNCYTYYKEHRQNNRLLLLKMLLQSY